ncbi:MAG: TonB family protein [Opitutaceae bacterium]|jgi:TonB family protein
MTSRFTFALFFVFTPKLTARILFIAALLVLPRALFAQTAEDFYHKGTDEEGMAQDAALEDFNHAIALNPKYAEAYCHRGQIEVLLNEIGDAIADFDRAIALNPSYARAYSDRGNAKLRNRDVDGAIADCDRAIVLAPRSLLSYVYRAKAKMAKKDFDGALADFDRAVALDPRVARFVDNDRALALKAKHDLAGGGASALAFTAGSDQATRPPPKLSDIDPEPGVPASAIDPPTLSQEAWDGIAREMQFWGQGGGVVQVGFEVDTKGQPHHPFVISSTNSYLDQPCMEAVSKALYRPASHDGAPVNSYVEVSMGFYAGTNTYIRHGLITDSVAAEIDIPDSKIRQSKLPAELQYDVPPKPVSPVFPVYPFELLRDNKSGNAQVGFLVSPTGKVEYPVPLHATQPDFCWALLAMVEQLKFQPALKDGKPSWAAMTIRRNFSRSSDDVQVNDTTLNLLDKLQETKPPFCPLEELDAPPKPLSSPPPAFPSRYVGHATEGQALLEVLIDEDGNVQLPRVVSATAPDFGYAALQGVSVWKFAPPTSHGKPVVAQTTIPITFNPPSSGPPPAVSPLVNLDGAQIIGLADLDQMPSPRSMIQPKYPPDLKGRGVAGTVVVGFVVDSGGNVQKAHVVTSSGSGELDQAAVDAVSAWQYNPGRKDGRVVNTRLLIPFNFDPASSN